jgi:hypothetical protein
MWSANFTTFVCSSLQPATILQHYSLLHVTTKHSGSGPLDCLAGGCMGKAVVRGGQKGGQKGKPQDADKKKARIRRKKENRVTKARKSGIEKEAVHCNLYIDVVLFC